MDVKATHTKHYISFVEHPNLLASQGFPPGWNFSSGELFLELFVHYYKRLTCCAKIAAPKVLHGLLAAGTDIWVCELSRKTLGQSYVPATVSVAHLLLAISNT